MNKETQMHALLEALEENLEGLSDEELLANVREEGESPLAVAKETRALINDTVKKFRQRGLVAAKEQHRLRVANLANLTVELPRSASERRSLFDAVVARQQAAGRMLTMQHREFAELTDADIETWLTQFGALGLLADTSKDRE